MKSIIAIVVLGALVAAGTVLAGWWTLPLIAFVWTALWSRRGGVIFAALSGAFGWALLLLIVRRSGPVGGVDRVLAGTLQLPRGGGIALTLLYAALLCGSAALLAQAIWPPCAGGSVRTRHGKS